MSFGVMLVIMIAIAFLIAVIFIFAANDGKSGEYLSVNFGKELNNRIDSKFYSVAIRGNHFDEYDDIQEEEVNGFIDYWYNESGDK